MLQGLSQSPALSELEKHGNLHFLTQMGGRTKKRGWKRINAGRGDHSSIGSCYFHEILAQVCMDQQLPGTLWDCCSSLAACCGGNISEAMLLFFQLFSLPKESVKPFSKRVLLLQCGGFRRSRDGEETKHVGAYAHSHK